MQDLWDRIDAGIANLFAERNAGLEEDDREEYPIDHFRGATPAKLDELATLIGYPLPEDFRASYLLRDGLWFQVAPAGPDLAGCQTLLSLEQIIHEVNFWGEYLRKSPNEAAEPRPADPRGYPHGPVASIMWSQGWLPFVGEGTGDHLCLDLDPPAEGTVGQVFDFGHEEGPTYVHFANFRAYMERFALDLERGYIQFEDMESCDSDSCMYTENVHDLRRRNPRQFDPPAES